MINIRIHTDQKWPERVVFDTTHLGLAPEARVDSETDNRRSETIAQAERQPFDAFAEMAAIPARPCFRPPCSSGQLQTGRPRQLRTVRGLKVARV
jgi:hypothetical protein